MSNTCVDRARAADQARRAAERGRVPCGELVSAAGQTPVCYLGHALAGCLECGDYRPGLTIEERTRCEVWSRVMGYHRPVAAWNPGKQQEHADRQQFREAAGSPEYSLAEGAGHD